MASFNTSGLRFFPFNGLTALSAFARVTVSNTGQLLLAGPTAFDVGNLDLDTGVGEVTAAVRMPTCPGSKKYIADTAITAWSIVYKSTTGYVTNASGASAGGPSDPPKPWASRRRPPAPRLRPPRSAPSSR